MWCRKSEDNIILCSWDRTTWDDEWWWHKHEWKFGARKLCCVVYTVHRTTQSHVCKLYPTRHATNPPFASLPCFLSLTLLALVSWNLCCLFVAEVEHEQLQQQHYFEFSVSVSVNGSTSTSTLWWVWQEGEKALHHYQVQRELDWGRTRQVPRSSSTVSPFSFKTSLPCFFFFRNLLILLLSPFWGPIQCFLDFFFFWSKSNEEPPFCLSKS